ncbi:MAG: HNH endonuclease [Cyanobacteria bacterium P01_F01_bin.150]
MSAYIPVALRNRVREHFQNLCAYCHTAESLAVTTFEIEHIVPQSAGGQDIFENLCLACPSCNRHKSTRQSVVDPNTQESHPIFHPHRQIWREHFAWSQAGSVLKGLTPVGRGTIDALKINRLSLVRVRKLWVKVDEHPPDGDRPKMPD